MQPERRGSSDRRSTTSSPFSHYRLLGRRKQCRRCNDSGVATQPHDWYQTRFLAITVTILLLCILDAHHTLMLLGMGAREVNPLMDVVIRHSSEMFVMCKLFLTGLGVIVLVAYHSRRLFFRVKTGHALYAILFCYALLMVYQVSMFPEGSYQLPLIYPI